MATATISWAEVYRGTHAVGLDVDEYFDSTVDGSDKVTVGEPSSTNTAASGTADTLAAAASTPYKAAPTSAATSALEETVLVASVVRPGGSNNEAADDAPRSSSADAVDPSAALSTLYCKNRERRERITGLEEQLRLARLEIERLRLLNEKLQESHSAMAKDASQEQASQRARDAAWRKRQALGDAERERLARELGATGVRNTQLMHERKKQELELQRVKEQLHRLIMEQGTACIEMPHALARGENGRRSMWNTAGTAVRQDRELTDNVLRNYEAKLRALTEGNQELSQTVRDLNKKVCSLREQPPPGDPNPSVETVLHFDSVGSSAAERLMTWTRDVTSRLQNVRYGDDMEPPPFSVPLPVLSALVADVQQCCCATSTSEKRPPSVDESLLERREQLLSAREQAVTEQKRHLDEERQAARVLCAGIACDETAAGGADDSEDYDDDSVGVAQTPPTLFDVSGHYALTPLSPVFPPDVSTTAASASATPGRTLTPGAAPVFSTPMAATTPLPPT
eukprot:TRINITY_DN78_c0_g1_i2.p1 TRINITY_DN78_c0_g1~~TRINITY_DN78_c0_g1_i2.p1  ORF type:complete len:544 (-),score=137.53 TRINITY_DN78_c0_g1_i2:2449-3987(-)